MKVKALTTFGSKKKLYEEGKEYEISEETRTYFGELVIEVEGGEDVDKPLEKMTKKELILLAAERNIEIDENMNKAELIERLS